ncbi:VWA domain-containing protein [Gordonia sp. PP30]|uniref:vWA domain-containing protein n=1 Tax=Gordonia sp. PP30 TaxID=2935861 RepID=UPI001FFFAA94|nr:VWA domain-containing protein [Gordonia sp. PP30]UQE76062.1 VWA domain-containing protein [Gordonia sp. PP30]
MTESLGTVLPFYLVADESGSMDPHMNGLNTALDDLLGALHEQSFATSKVRLAILGFNNQARVYLPPTDLREVTHLPSLAAEATTEYASAFDLLTAQIPYDVQQLKAQGFSVTRPAVYFLTDGLPTDDGRWQPARERLLSIRERPNLLAFGMGDADADVVRAVATEPKYAFLVRDGVSVADALVEFFSSLTQSIIQSGQNVAAGQNKLEIERPANFISLDMDVL